MAEKMFAEMTIAEKFIAIAGVVEDTEMVEFLEKRAEQAIRKASAPRKTKENEEAKAFRAAVATAVAEMEGTFTSKMVAAAMGESTNRVAYALTKLEKEGVLVLITEGVKKSDPKTYAMAE